MFIFPVQLTMTSRIGNNLITRLIYSSTLLYVHCDGDIIIIRPLSIRRAFLLAYLDINSMWKSISEKRQCSAKNRHNAQHNKHKSIRCATKRIKARPAAYVSGSYCVTPAGTSNELDVQNGWEENTHTHCYNMHTESVLCIHAYILLYTHVLNKTLL